MQNFVQILDGTWRAKKCSKRFFNVLERQNMQNETISELCINDKKIKYSNNPQYILKSTKFFYKDLYTRGNVSIDAINELLVAALQVFE